MKKPSKIGLQRVLTTELNLQEPRFRLERRGDWWNGSIISETFRKKRDHQRQKMIWDALKRSFGSDASRFVGMLLAYTPDEWDIDTVLVYGNKAKAG